MIYIFNETQKFNKWWHYLIVALPLLFAFGIYLGTWIDFMPMQGDNKKVIAISTFTFSLIFSLLIFIWFFILKLKTQINSEGIVVHFFGVPFCKRTIKWEEIQSISIIKYSPLSDYGGWGVRYSLSGNGWCYNISGPYGIKLFYKNGNPFLIGTQQKEEAESIINLFFKK